MCSGVGTHHMWHTSTKASSGGKLQRHVSLGVQRYVDLASRCPCSPKQGAQHTGREHQ